MRLSRTTTAGWLVALTAAATSLVAQQPTKPVGFGTIQGTVTDSIHRAPLVGAVLLIDGVARMGVTGPDGHYMVDSLPPGTYQLHLSHPVLDTIGLAMSTRPIVLAAGDVITVDMGLPSGAHIISVLCPEAMLARGPGALVGQVVDPESDRPATGSKVQLLYQEVGPLGAKTKPTIREATVDSSGSYRICGLPSPLDGKLQVFRNGVSSGQVDIRLDPGPLAIRSLSIIATRVVATVTDSGGKARQISVGTARLTGKVVNKSGTPIQAARVAVAGAGSVTLTNARGEFRLDSLPLGTQSVEVRKIGYGATDKSVELGGREAATVTVIMSDYALPAMVVEADRDKGLADLGYLERKQRGNGFFIDGDKIRPSTKYFSDVVRQAPMLRVTQLDNGKFSIKNARDPNLGCVNFVVDGSQFKELTAGDIDDYVQPSEIRAIEVYGPATAPARFVTPGTTDCTAVVIWTVRSTNRPRK